MSHRFFIMLNGLGGNRACSGGCDRTKQVDDCAAPRSLDDRNDLEPGRAPRSLKRF